MKKRSQLIKKIVLGCLLSPIIMITTPFIVSCSSSNTNNAPLPPVNGDASTTPEPNQYEGLYTVVQPKEHISAINDTVDNLEYPAYFDGNYSKNWNENDKNLSMSKFFPAGWLQITKYDDEKKAYGLVYYRQDVYRQFGTDLLFDAQNAKYDRLYNYWTIQTPTLVNYFENGKLIKVPKLLNFNIILYNVDESDLKNVPEGTGGMNIEKDSSFVYRP